jgi:hypothetical protein
VLLCCCVVVLLCCCVVVLLFCCFVVLLLGAVLIKTKLAYLQTKKKFHVYFFENK